MYILNKTYYNHALQKIKQANEELYQVQEAISTGKQINRPSDHPGGTQQVLNYRSILATIQQYSENIEFAHDWCQTTDHVLESAYNLLLRCREIGYSQASGTNSEEIRAVAAQEVSGIYEDLLALANTEYDGRYLFAPERIDLPPFDPATVLDEMPPDSPPEFLMRVKIGDEKEIQINTSKDAFTGGGEGKNIFRVVNQLKTSLENNDQEAILAVIEELDQTLKQISRHQAMAGCKMRDLDRYQELLTKLKYTTETSLSQKEDADITEKLMELIQKENNYSISLSTLSKILHINLLDLIG